MPICVYEELDNQKRKQLLKVLADLTLDDQQEEIVLNILRSAYSKSSPNELKELLNYLFTEKIDDQKPLEAQNTIFYGLNSSMDDGNFFGAISPPTWGYKDNNRLFIQELIKIHKKAFPEEYQKAFDAKESLLTQESYCMDNYVIENGSAYYQHNGYKVNVLAVNKVRIVVDYILFDSEVVPQTLMPTFVMEYLAHEVEKKLIKTTIATVIDLGLLIVGVGEYIQIAKAGSKIAAWGKKVSSLVEIVDIVASNSIILDLFAHYGLSEEFIDKWKKFHTVNLYKGNFVSLSRSLNRDLFNSIYQEWNTIIGNVGEVVGNNTRIRDYQSKTKEITNYLNELKSYFDNEDGIIY